ncbi:uncharacterized protein LOC128930130 [Callithrix jacchus]
MRHCHRFLLSQAENQIRTGQMIPCPGVGEGSSPKYGERGGSRRDQRSSGGEAEPGQARTGEEAAGGRRPVPAGRAPARQALPAAPSIPLLRPRPGIPSPPRVCSRAARPGRSPDGGRNPALTSDRPVLPFAPRERHHPSLPPSSPRPAPWAPSLLPEKRFSQKESYWKASGSRGEAATAARSRSRAGARGSPAAYRAARCPLSAERGAAPAPPSGRGGNCAPSLRGGSGHTGDRERRL